MQMKCLNQFSRYLSVALLTALVPVAAMSQNGTVTGSSQRNRAATESKTNASGFLSKNQSNLLTNDKSKYSSPKTEVKIKENNKPLSEEMKLEIQKKYFRGGTGVDGGGGSDIVAEFVIQAHGLLNRLEVSYPKVTEIRVLKKLLAGKNLRILPVEKLIDIVSGNPIPHQGGLIAYGLPGLVQLKTKDWDEAFKTNKNMDHHIFHELCRAAAPDCDDEAYRISIIQLGLAPTSYAPAPIAVDVAQRPELLMKVSIEKADIAGIKTALAMGFKINNVMRLGPGPGYTSYDILSPLAYAAMLGNDKSLDILLKLGADVNFQDDVGQTALHRAAAFNRVSSIRYLVAHGADMEVSGKIYIPNQGGWKRTPPGSPNQPTPLLATIRSSALDAALTLIELGAKLDYVNMFNQNNADNIDSPLGQAIKQENLVFVRLFLASGARNNQRFWGCWNPLTCAAHLANFPIVIELLKAGANPNEVVIDRWGTNGPLLNAKTLPMVRLLLSSGARADYVSPQGITALQEHADDGNIEILGELIKAGAPINQIRQESLDHPAMTALDIAEMQLVKKPEMREAFNFLRALGAKRAKELK